MGKQTAPATRGAVALLSEAQQQIRGGILDKECQEKMTGV
jgi:hypothetical protein